MPMPLDAREPERHAARVAWACLQAVERHLDHQLGPNVHDDALPRGLEPEEALGLPGKHLVGHPLEGLAEHDEPAVRIAGAEVEVAEPSVATPVAPLGGQDDQIERMCALDLEPAGAAPAGLI